jgi:hypothetical protein
MKYQIAFVIVCLVIVSACEKEDNTYMLNGIWVEKILSSDTIIFFNASENPFFEFKSLPENRPGLYQFHFAGDSIKLLWLFSSAADPETYYFRLNAENHEFTIGNFFDKDRPEENIEFVKIP